MTNTDIKILWMNPSKLKPNPKNNNKHTKDQIERLAKILKYQGQRTPIVVSNLSGFMVKGHATLEAMKLNKTESVAVTYQDFDDATQEMLYMTSDNSIAEWSEIDLSAVKVELPNLGEFDYDLLGFKDIGLEAAEADMPDLASGDKSTLNTMTFTLTNEQKNSVERALEMAKDMGEFVDTGNENTNGNSIARMSELFLAKEYDV